MIPSIRFAIPYLTPPGSAQAGLADHRPAGRPAAINPSPAPAQTGYTRRDRSHATLSSRGRFVDTLV